MPKADPCTVVVTVDGDPEDVKTVLEHARAGLPVFEESEGFLEASLDLSLDGSRLVNVQRWESKALYQRCVDDPRWEKEPTWPAFAALAREGRVDVDARVYVRVAQAAPPN